jgi:GNAT superfamily N-acetyltransferase
VKDETVPRSRIRCEPLTVERWADLLLLFGPRGACAGCWCQYWRRSHAAFAQGKGRGNRDALRRQVAQGSPPGILAYRGGRAIGWCAIAPRESFPRLERSRVLARVDDTPVWSITCLFVAKTERNQGVSRQLIRAACRYAQAQSARVVEGYPVEVAAPRADPFMWTGVASAFRGEGFTEVLRRGPTRPIMRRRA